MVRILIFCQEYTKVVNVLTYIKTLTPSYIPDSITTQPCLVPLVGIVSTMYCTSVRAAVSAHVVSFDRPE
jgi:hypothetical protein